MNDFTMCRSCNRNSHGEEYCRVCEREVADREQKVEKLGYEPPVTVLALSDRHQLMDKNNDCVATVWCNNPTMAELVQGLADYLTERAETFLNE